jgi:hypothetical protein
MNRGLKPPARVVRPSGEDGVLRGTSPSGKRQFRKEMLDPIRAGL